MPSPAIPTQNKKREDMRMNENEKNYDDMTDEEIDEGIEGLLELLR